MGTKTKLNSPMEITVKKSNKQAKDDVKDYSSFKIVLFYCSLIVFLPVITFFSLKSVVLDTFFAMSELRSNIYSAISAVLALHIALALYIYRAYFGSETTPQKPNKMD